jgi:hypothetical protein
MLLRRDKLGSFWVCFWSCRKAFIFVTLCQIKGFESAGGGQDWVRLYKKGAICRGFSAGVKENAKIKM